MSSFPGQGSIVGAKATSVAAVGVLASSVVKIDDFWLPPRRTIYSSFLVID